MPRTPNDRHMPTPETHPDTLASLLRMLDLTPAADADTFEGQNVDSGRKRIYGGQVLAQAVIAACRTVPPERPIHSLHGYFLVGGNPRLPVTYAVERLRDGGSFTTRRVVAKQAGVSALFAMIGSFHGDEPGLSHGSDMPVTPAPEDVDPIETLLQRGDIAIPDAMRAYYSRELPIDVRFVDLGKFQPGFSGGSGQPARQRIWFKAKAALPDDPTLHRALLAYASDFALVETALLPHGKMVFGGDMQLASLDHALWFHRPVRLDDWLLYALDSPTAGGGRGFSRGSFYNRSGDLVASVAQELLMRSPATR
ncbi:MAG: acyl-CoA thioesterase II [Hyphomicrobium aestuarii]|nr:acyl-CoA thioesterase II [Hyphomicrobium aestuarii]